MLRPEPLDLVIILIIGMLLFGANRLPETARAIGKAMREFRDAVNGKDETKPTDANNSSSNSHPDSS
jgi:sec-independent protein translocase protein TatA